MNEVDAALNIEQKKQMLGCDETSCFVEIAGALGTDYLVMGSVSVIKNVFALSVKLVNATTGLPVDQAYERFSSKSGVELFNAAEKAAQKLLRALEARKPQEEAEIESEDEVLTHEQAETEEAGISLWVWVATGVAAAGLGAGVTGSVMYLGAESDYDELDKTRVASRSERDDVESKGKTGALLQNIGYPLAGAGAVGSLLIYFLSDGGSTGEDTPSLNIAPTPFGLAIEGSF